MYNLRIVISGSNIIAQDDGDEEAIDRFVVDDTGREVSGIVDIVFDRLIRYISIVSWNCIFDRNEIYNIQRENVIE